MQQPEDKLPDHQLLGVTSGPEHVRDVNVINLLDYAEVVAKRWRMIFTVMSIAFVISIAYTLQMKNIYSSTALIIPPQQESGMMGMMNAMTGGMSSLAGDLLGRGKPADLYVGMLNSRTVKDAIIDRFHLMEIYEQKYRVNTYKMLDQVASIEAGKKDGIISITVEDKDPKLAAQLANAFVEELGKLTVKLGVIGAVNNKAFLEDRLGKAKVDLSRAEESMKKFQSANKALDVPEQAKAAFLGLAQAKAQLAVQEVQLAALRSRFTDSAQEVIDIKATVTKLRAQIEQLEGKGRGSSIPSLGSVPELGQEYIRVMREFKLQETIVELLTKQYEMAKLTEAKDSSTIQVIQTARESDRKSKPKRSKIVIAITFAAGFCALVYAFICEAGERMSPKDCEQLNRICGMLPKIKRKSK